MTPDVDALLERTLDNATPDWRTRAEQAIAQLAATEPWFTATNVRELVGEPDNPNRWGALFRNASRAGVIRGTGYLASGRKSRHQAPVRVWVRA